MNEPDPILTRLAARMARPFDGYSPGPDPAAAVERGKRVPAALLEQARQSPGRVRIVRPGQPMTMDLRPDRLTIIVDERDHVVSARRG